MRYTTIDQHLNTFRQRRMFELPQRSKSQLCMKHNSLLTLLKLMK